MITMTQHEVNKYLTEKVLGECWHEEDRFAFYPNTCDKCNKENFMNPDFSLDQFYGPMIRKCMEKEWWYDFFYWFWGSTSCENVVEKLFTPALGSAAIVEFLKGRE